MERVTAFIDSLNTGHWIAIFAIIVGGFFGSFTVANYLAGRRERKLKTYETTPEVKATINRTSYRDNWRSVQLHMVAPTEHPQNFQYANWHIERARLLRPWSAVLARTENDDYATGVFYPDKSCPRADGQGCGPTATVCPRIFYQIQNRGGQREAGQVQGDIFAYQRPTQIYEKSLGRSPYRRLIARHTASQYDVHGRHSYCGLLALEYEATPPDVARDTPKGQFRGRRGFSANPLRAVIVIAWR